jgi:hypothetical protein
MTVTEGTHVIHIIAIVADTSATPGAGAVYGELITDNRIVIVKAPV